MAPCFLRHAVAAALMPMLLVPTPALGDPEGTGGARAPGETEARELYESAFRALADGRYGTAYGYLNDLTARHPRTLFAPIAAERKRRLEEFGLHLAGRGPGDRAGRTGALVYGTLYSTWLGVGSAIVAGADSDQAPGRGNDDRGPRRPGRHPSPDPEPGPEPGAGGPRPARRSLGHLAGVRMDRRFRGRTLRAAADRVFDGRGTGRHRRQRRPHPHCRRQHGRRQSSRLGGNLGNVVRLLPLGHGPKRKTTGFSRVP